MSPLSEERFREHLDARGLLKPGSFTLPDRSVAYTVFAQREFATFDVGALKAQAARFFGVKLGLSVDKHYGDEPPSIDAARLVVASDDGSTAGTRVCFGRRVSADDYVAAEAAERAQGTSGMLMLAQRCRTVWLVVLESDNDRAALTIAAILASSLLGPILAPSGTELFGVRTARLKLEGQTGPYR